MDTESSESVEKKEEVKRENGFYWIKHDGAWKVAEWDDNGWYLPGLTNTFKDDDFGHVGNYQLKVKLLP